MFLLHGVSEREVLVTEACWLFPW